MMPPDVLSGSVDEVAYWLDQNAPRWRMRWSKATLVPGTKVGQPTTVKYTVQLEAVGMPYDMWIEGEGETPLAAVQYAVGIGPEL